MESKEIVCAAMIAGALSFMGSCTSQNRETESDSTASRQTEYFHADNDIAMTVRSLVDAIKVGERLDSTDYDFRGILTDGAGTPLYTDVSGAPGLWEVEVISPTQAVVRNLNPGDLLPDDLTDYIVSAISLGDDAPVEYPAQESDGDKRVAVYHFGGGSMRIEISGISPESASEGPMMKIMLSSTTAHS